MYGILLSLPIATKDFVWTPFIDSLFRKLSSKLGHFSEYVIAYDKFDFSDVPKDAYYMNAIAWAVEKDITKGTTKTT